jgi:ribosomal protein S19
MLQRLSEHLRALLARPVELEHGIEFFTGRIFLRKRVQPHLQGHALSEDSGSYKDHNKSSKLKDIS